MTKPSPAGIGQIILECTCAWFIAALLGLVILDLWPESFFAAALSSTAVFVSATVARSPEIVVLLCVAAIATLIKTSPH